MQTIELHLRAKHFEGTEYVCYGPCAIEKALKEISDYEMVSEHVDCVDVIKEGQYMTYNHDDYGSVLFNRDARTAATHNFDDTIIRTLILTPCPKN